MILDIHMVHDLGVRLASRNLEMIECLDLRQGRRH